MIDKHCVRTTMKKVIISFSAVLLLAGCSDQAKIKPETTPSSTSNKVTQTASPLPQYKIDINTEKLPQDFKGADIAKLYSELEKKAPLEKDEFESTTDYENKIKAAITDEIYPFMINFNYLGPNYDADSQQLKLRVKTEKITSNNEVLERPSMIIDTDATIRTYLTTNALVGTVMVKGFEGSRYGIAIVNGSDFLEGIGSYLDEMFKARRHIDFAINMAPNKAKELKDKIRVLLLCKLSLYKNDKQDRSDIFDKPGNDLIFKRHWSYDATIDSPKFANYELKYINVKILSIWLYDISTGAIVSKHNLQSNKES